MESNFNARYAGTCYRVLSTLCWYITMRSSSSSFRSTDLNIWLLTIALSISGSSSRRPRFLEWLILTLVLGLTGKPIRLYRKYHSLAPYKLSKSFDTAFQTVESNFNARYAGTRHRV